jgi:hypothetical protein
MKYLLCDYLAGIYDVKKTASNTEDDLMCWAAAASNILAWSKWGFPPTKSFTNASSIFQYFQDHWFDRADFVKNAWKWWFDGKESPNVDVPGGGFWKDTPHTFEKYCHCETDRTKVLLAIDQFLHHGWGVVLNLTTLHTGHYLTCWGYEYNAHGDYVGIYVTDSDDPQKNGQRFYQLSQSGWAGYPGWWYIQYGLDQRPYLIADVHALERFPSQTDSTPPSPPNGVKIIIGN